MLPALRMLISCRTSPRPASRASGQALTNHRRFPVPSFRSRCTTASFGTLRSEISGYCRALNLVQHQILDLPETLCFVSPSNFFKMHESSVLRSPFHQNTAVPLL